MAQSLLERIVDRLNAAALGLSVLLLTATVGIVTLNVVTRYLLNDSLTWSSELARYALVWSAMLSAAALVGRGEHFAVDVLERRLVPAWRRRLNIVTAVLSLTFFLSLFVSGTMLVIGSAGQRASSIDVLPMSAVYAVVPISSVLMIAGCALRLLRATDGGEPGP